MKFRSFWGEMAELRRFQDGSICEAVVWDCKTVAERRRVVGKIVKLILNRFVVRVRPLKLLLPILALLYKIKTYLLPCREW